MKPKGVKAFSLSVFALAFLILACTASSTVANDEATKVATEEWLPTIAAMQEAMDETAKVADPNYTPEPSPTIEDCDFVNPVDGECLISFDWPEIPSIYPGELLGTPQSELELPEPLMLVRTGSWREIKDQPGEVDFFTPLGRFVPGAIWQVHESASGLLRTPVPDEELPEKNPETDHYWGQYPTGWMEDVDLTEDLRWTRCAGHDWDHPRGEDLCHAHLFDSEGNLIAQISSNVKVLAVPEIHPNGVLYFVILQKVWIESSGMEILEKYYE